MPVIKGIRYAFNEVPESVLESLSLAELREIAFQEESEMQQAAIAQHETTQAVEAEAERANAADFKAWRNHEPEPVKDDSEWLTKEEIEQRQIKAQAKYAEESKPEVQLQRAAEAEEESLQKRIENLRYVRDEMEKGVEPVKQLARQAAAEQIAEQNASLAIQTQFCVSHPEYIRDVHNGELMRDFVRDNGYQAFSIENLELAFSVLRGKLHLLNPAQVAAQKELEQVVRTGETPRPRRQASTVSTVRADGGFYSQPAKHEYTEEELELMDLGKLEELAGGFEGSNRSVLSQFGRF